MKSQKVIFRKITETAQRASSTQAAYSEHSIATHSISMPGYVMAILAFVLSELTIREASNFCDFGKLTSCDFTAFFSFFTKVNPWGIFMCLIRITIANLCPNSKYD